MIDESRLLRSSSQETRRKVMSVTGKRNVTNERCRLDSRASGIGESPSCLRSPYKLTFRYTSLGLRVLGQRIAINAGQSTM